MKAVLSAIASDLKALLAFLGVLGAVAGQVAVYAPQVPASQKGLAVATTVIGVTLAFGTAALKLIEDIQGGNAPAAAVDVEQLAAAVAAKMSAGTRREAPAPPAPPAPPV